MRPDAICPEKEALISYLYDEFEEGADHDRRSIARHLDGCDRCASEMAALGSVRETLTTWKTPDATLGFRVVQETPAFGRRWWQGWSPAFPMAAAATLVLGAALGLARFDIQYDASGLRVRTGWGQPAPAALDAQAGVSSIQTAAASMPPASLTEGDPIDSTVVSAAPVVGASVAPPAAANAPWRTDLAVLERQFRMELAAVRQGYVAAAPITDGPAWLRQVQQLIDQSEVRQQQNLALRMAEVSRDFDVQRRSDLVLIEQGFDRLAGQDAQQQRMLMNAIRVSQQPPPR